ncbi:oxidoreductase ucpA [Colletotrichum salicis]|uniref:Oxidoreductase ucpA n=1 Tax=Colletotrichum salicis TaxID=1209931 RepID=A0A135U6W0_9PEZI|nr:oxidoreductase ucpA [Colletotrichum salicis]
MLDLQGKVALVIGLGQSGSDGWGIGAACAVTFAAQGAAIFGGNRTVESTTKTKTTIEEAGGVCDVVATNATSSASVKALVEACVAKHGRIDILLANVGGSQPGSAASMGEETWDAQVELNLKSVYLACHHVLPIMEAQEGGGSIVCVSSIAGMRYIGKPQVAYNTAKAAVMQFVKATAVVYAKKGVRLNTVVPGLMETPYTRQLAESFPAKDGSTGGGYEAFKRMREEQVPMGRMGDAWDVANAAAFLASDEARVPRLESTMVLFVIFDQRKRLTSFICLWHEEKKPFQGIDENLVLELGFPTSLYSNRNIRPVPRRHSSYADPFANPFAMNSHIYSSSWSTLKSNLVTSSLNGHKYVLVTLESQNLLQLHLRLLHLGFLDRKRGRLSILMEAQERELVSFAPLYGVRDGGPADDEALVFDAGEGL